MTTNSPIRVLIADDSAFMRVAITRMVESDPELQVCGTAVNGRDALKKLAALDPDVVTLDVAMPEMNGLETLRHIMARAPRPVIMLSSLTAEGAETSLDALDHGAFDCIAKPSTSALLDMHQLRDELVAKLKTAVRTAHRRMLLPLKPRPPRPSSTGVGTLDREVPRVRPRVFCIGASGYC